MLANRKRPPPQPGSEPDAVVRLGLSKGSGEDAAEFAAINASVAEDLPPRAAPTTKRQRNAIQNAQFDSELRAEIGRYIHEHGVNNAVAHFNTPEQIAKREARDGRPSLLSVTNARKIGKEYVRLRVAVGSEVPIDKLPARSIGRPSILASPDFDLDQRLLNKCTADRAAGAVINSRLVTATAFALMKFHQPHKLKDNGGSVSFSKGWANKWMTRHGFTGRKTVKDGCKRPSNYFEVESDFLERFQKVVSTGDIPPDLILNCDEIASTVLPTQAQAVTQCKVVTVFHTITMSGELLAPQLIYEGKTDRSHPKDVQFPVDWNVTHSDSNSSTYDTMNQWFFKILLPYVVKTRERLGLFAEHPAVLLLDLFTSHRGDVFKGLCTQNNICMIFVPGGCSSDLQPLDFLFEGPWQMTGKRSFNAWYAEHYRPDQLTLTDAPRVLPLNPSGGPTTSLSLGQIPVLSSLGAPRNLTTLTEPPLPSPQLIPHQRQPSQRPVSLPGSHPVPPPIPSIPPRSVQSLSSSVDLGPTSHARPHYLPSGVELSQPMSSLSQPTSQPTSALGQANLRPLSSGDLGSAPTQPPPPSLQQHLSTDLGANLRSLQHLASAADLGQGTARTLQTPEMPSSSAQAPNRPLQTLPNNHDTPAAPDLGQAGTRPLQTLSAAPDMTGDLNQAPARPLQTLSATPPDMPGTSAPRTLQHVRPPTETDRPLHVPQHSLSTLSQPPLAPSPMNTQRLATQPLTHSTSAPSTASTPRTSAATSMSTDLIPMDAPSDVVVDVSLSTLKVPHAKWLIHTVAELSKQHSVIRRSWRQAKIHGACFPNAAHSSDDDDDMQHGASANNTTTTTTASLAPPQPPPAITLPHQHQHHHPAPQQRASLHLSLTSTGTTVKGKDTPAAPPTTATTPAAPATPVAPSPNTAVAAPTHAPPPTPSPATTPAPPMPIGPQ